MSIARRLIERSGLIDVLGPSIDADVGRPRHLSLLGFLVACQLNALNRHHQGHLVEVARTLNAMTDAQRQSLGAKSWDPDESYPRVARLFTRLCEVLESGDAGVDATWFANQLARAAVPKEFWVSRSVAVDGTDVETWGALHGEAVTVELDGEATETQLVKGNSGNRAKQPARRAKVLGIGDDGRKRYTADPDARAGHRSATNSRPAGPYIGYELHLAVQARDVRWTNNIDRTTLEPEVPGVITTFNLVPAGTHRGRSVVESLIDAKGDGHEINDVVWDPGYSLCKAESTAHPLAQAGIAQTFQVVTHQRGSRPFSGDALLIDGQLYSSHLPQDLHDLPVPPRGASEEEKLVYEAKFNQRARWRLVRHAGPDADGVTRWRCPFCAGLLRSRQFPKTLRLSRRVPLVQVTPDVDRCCAGTFSVTPAELALHQRIPFGTTAWRISMGRRQVVESVNAALKGAFVDLARGFFRVFGQLKMTVLLGFTVAAYNLDRIRSFRTKHDLNEEGSISPIRNGPITRSKRRTGTWAEVIDAVEGPSEIAVASRPSGSTLGLPRSEFNGRTFRRESAFVRGIDFARWTRRSTEPL